jgi:predicted enzyme related to lactoylglutathione lyase
MPINSVGTVCVFVNDQDGVTFVQEPDVQPWGTYATLEDSEGNHILLVEQPR